MSVLHWGLIGCGDIARKRVAPAFRDLDDREKHLEPGQPVSFEIQDLKVPGKRWRARRVQTEGGRYVE